MATNKSWGDGDDLCVFAHGSGRDGGDAGQGWIDSIRLEDADGASLNRSEWSVELDSDSVLSESESYLELSSDSSGKIVLNDGSEMVCDGVDRIEF